MTDMFIRIVTEAQEAEDEFIFTTIQPFCEDVIKRKISKSELIKLLLQPRIVRCGECKYSRDYKHTKEYVNCEVDSSESIDRDANWYCADGERRADDETD
jgi:hypothetical protein